MILENDCQSVEPSKINWNEKIILKIILKSNCSTPSKKIEKGSTLQLGSY